MSYTRGPGVRHWHAIGTRTEYYSITSAPSGSGAYPTADLAIYCPVRVFERVIVRKLYSLNGTTASGNIDVGVYDSAGTRLVSAGTTAQAGTNGVQTFDVTDSTIGPGLYFVAVTLDNTTGTIIRDPDAAPLDAAYGVLTEQLGAGAALPATATWAVAQTLAYMPSIGFFISTAVL